MRSVHAPYDYRLFHVPAHTSTALARSSSCLRRARFKLASARRRISNRDREVAEAGASRASDAAASSQALGARKRPNILLIVADDLGYSDIGAFGGEIHTPNLDTLAARRPLAHRPSRGADVLADALDAVLRHRSSPGRPRHDGRDPAAEAGRQARLRGLLERARAVVRGPAARQRLPHVHRRQVAPRPDRGQEPDGVGLRVVVRARAGRRVALRARSRAPHRRRRLDVPRERRADVSVPDDFYSTDFYTDKLLEYLDAHRGDGKPFLALATYTSPHWPLQAPDAFIDRYKGRYDAGYEAIRKRRIAAPEAARRDPVGLRSRTSRCRRAPTIPTLGRRSRRSSASSKRGAWRSTPRWSRTSTGTSGA